MSKPIDKDSLTVHEAARLLPDSEYIRAYKELARRGLCTYDPDMLYKDLPGLFLKKTKQIGLLLGLRCAFADIERGCTLWDISREERDG